MKKKFFSAFSLILLFVTSLDLYSKGLGAKRRSSSTKNVAKRSTAIRAVKQTPASGAVKQIVITKKEEIVEEAIALEPDSIFKEWQKKNEMVYDGKQLDEKQQKYANNIFSEVFEYVFLSALAAKCITKPMNVAPSNDAAKNKHNEIVSKNEQDFEAAEKNKSNMYEVTKPYLIAKIKESVFKISPVAAMRLGTFQRGWMRSDNADILFARLCRKYMDFIKFCIGSSDDAMVFAQMRGAMAIFIRSVDGKKQNIRQDLILMNELKDIVRVCTVPKVADKNAQQLLKIQNERLNLVKKILGIKFNIAKSSSGTWIRVAKGAGYTVLAGGVLALMYWGTAIGIAKAEEKKWLKTEKIGERMLAAPGKLISEIGKIGSYFKNKAQGAIGSFRGQDNYDKNRLDALEKEKVDLSFRLSQLDKKQDKNNYSVVSNKLNEVKKEISSYKNAENKLNRGYGEAQVDDLISEQNKNIDKFKGKKNLTSEELKERDSYNNSIRNLKDWKKGVNKNYMGA
jgi:hypothetical protein